MKNPIMSKLQQTTSSSVVSGNPTENSIVFEGHQEEEMIFELLLDNKVEESNCWNIVETSYDVVTFKSDEEILFQELSNWE